MLCINGKFAWEPIPLTLCNTFYGLGLPLSNKHSEWGYPLHEKKKVESPQKLINVNTVRHEKGLEIDAKSRRLILSEGISTIYLHISVQQALKRYLNGNLYYY